MNNKLFGRTNANDLIFKVETQEGSEILEGDEGLASIGDATMEHIQNLNPLRRQAYDEYHVMPDGNIFRSEDNPRWDDPDEFNLRNKDELSRFLQRNKIPDSLRGVYEEAEQKASEEDASEDVMDHPEELIPYEDWEKYGGMSKYWDIPATPKPRLVFSGNTRQAFYDDFAEDHPLGSFVNRVINTLDGFSWHQIILSEDVEKYNTENDKKLFRPETGSSYIYTDGSTEFLIADEYVNSLRESLFKQGGRFSKVSMTYRVNVYNNLSEMITTIASDAIKDFAEPSSAVIACLAKLDRHHFEIYKKETIRKTKEHDPLYIYLCELGQRALKMTKQGKDGLREISKFGQSLFMDGFATEKLVNVSTGDVPEWEKQTVVEKGRNHHWEKYDLIKKSCERILVKKASRKMSDSAAACIERIRVAFNEALEAQNLRHFTRLATDFMQAQKSGKLDLSGADRNKVWAEYNLAKKDLVDMLEDIKAGITPDGAVPVEVAS